MGFARMKRAALRTSGGKAIPIRIAAAEGKVLVECRDAKSFVQHLFAEHGEVSLSKDSFARGVVIEGEGCYVQVFDQFGAVTEELPRIDHPDVDRLLWKALIAEA